MNERLETLKKARERMVEERDAHVKVLAAPFDRDKAERARNNIPRIGRVLIAQGRDAADVPITQTFGPNTLVNFTVWTDEVV